MIIITFLAAITCFIVVTCISLFAFRGTGFRPLPILVITTMTIAFPFSILGIALAYMIAREMP